MRTGSWGIHIIKLFEGLRLKAYRPLPDDVWTIGWGHTKGVKEGDVITKPWAEYFLRKDLMVYERCVQELVKVPLNQNQFDALVSFCFNLGCGNFKKSTMLKILNMGQYKLCGQFIRWSYFKGRKLPGLERRRKAECALFNRPFVELKPI